MASPDILDRLIAWRRDAPFPERDIILAAMSEIERLREFRSNVIQHHVGHALAQENRELRAELDIALRQLKELNLDARSTQRRLATLWGFAAEEEPGHVVVTWDENKSRILAVTRQDDDGKIIKIIAQTRPEVPENAPADSSRTSRIALAPAGETSSDASANKTRGFGPERI